MTKWEYYKVEYSSYMNLHTGKVTDHFRDLGNVGWELVCYDGKRYIFKRPVVEKEPDNRAFEELDCHYE